MMHQMTSAPIVNRAELVIQRLRDAGATHIDLGDVLELMEREDHRPPWQQLSTSPGEGSALQGPTTKMTFFDETCDRTELPPEKPSTRAIKLVGLFTGAGAEVVFNLDQVLQVMHLDDQQATSNQKSKK